MSEIPWSRWEEVYKPAYFADTKQQHFSPSEPQETSILNSNSHLNHSSDIFDMSVNETITISSDSEPKLEADTAENREGSLQCNEVRPSVDTASFSTAAAQTDNMNETQKHGAVAHGANEANGLYQPDLSIIGQSNEEPAINTIFLAACPDSSIRIPGLPSTSPAFNLPRADETDKESQNSINNVKGCIKYMPTSSTSTPLDNVPYTPETCPFTQLCPDIINTSDAEANSNEISFTEPKSPTIRCTRRAKVLHAASTLEGDGLDRNYSGASNKTGCNNDCSNKSDDSDGDDEDDDDDKAESEYCPSVMNSGKQEKRHLDHNTDDENEQPRRKRCKLGQSLAKSGPSRDGGSHSPASTRPLTPRRKITPKRNQPSPATGAVYEERTFSDGTTVKRAIIDGKEILQIDQPGNEDGLRLERSYTIHTQRNVTACDKHGTTANTEITGNWAKRTPRVTYTPKEDRLLKRLRLAEQLPWDAVYREFNNEFPDRRSCASLQVRFSTKLKAQ